MCLRAHLASDESHSGLGHLWLVTVCTMGFNHRPQADAWWALTPDMLLNAVWVRKAGNLTTGALLLPGDGQVIEHFGSYCFC